MLAIKIGTDPEVFLEDANGKSYSGHDLIPGTKLEPYPVMNGAIQVDGVALEFNTDPAETAEEFIFNIESVLSQMTAEFKKNAPFLNIKITPTTFFPYIVFSPYAPYASRTAFSGSESSRIVRWSFARKRASLAGWSGEIASTP